MDLAFLSAAVPIVKQYERDSQGKLIKKPYPFVYEFTSEQETATDLPQLHSLLTNYSALGACLLKGRLNRPLQSESRAGSTSPDDRTDWICLDLDGVQGFSSPQDFLDAIGCQDVEHVVQWSSSMGIENSLGLRCHIFLKLDHLVHPQLLKNWLMHLNLVNPILRQQLELTKSENSLRWPLDITTCQNDKLLYIAPPKLGANIRDPYPLGNRISYHAGPKGAVTLPQHIPNKDWLRTEQDKVVNELREKGGLPKRKKSQYKFDGTVEYMANPSAATITGRKSERGFTYFNINGGDSWAYYHPDGDSRFIHNFKGEPIYRTQDLFPEYWAELCAASANAQPTASGKIYLAFRDFETGNYFNGVYDASTDVLRLAQAKSETQLRSFMKQHGQPMGDFIPDWDIVFDPKSPFVVDPQTRLINQYVPSAYFKDPKPPYAASPPPTAHKVISHVLGQDPATIDHFYNWLTVIVHDLDMTGTAWILHGTQGTGKGVLFNRILAPLFGFHNTTSKRMEELESEFTGFMENQFVVFIDEIESGRSLYHDKINAKLKTLIAEPRISVRRMYSPAKIVKNFSNMIFASNKPAPVEVAPDDRRYNVAPYQGVPIILSAQELDTLDTEIGSLYAYLMARTPDRQLARTPLISAARSQLMDVSTTAIDTVTAALTQGDLEYLWDQLPAARPDGDLSINRALYERYRALVTELVANPTSSASSKLTREELQTIFEWTIGGTPKSPNKFTSLLKHHRIHMSHVWKHNRTVRGIDVNWKFNPTWLAQAQADVTAGNV